MNAPGSPKRSIINLAIFGGDSLFPEAVAVGQPNIPDVEGVVNDVRQILSSGTLSNSGPFVQRLEEEICRITGTDHCIATCNATAALELTCRALGLTGEVIVPSFTFVATAHALAWQGLVPVFVDVDPVTHTMSPASVESAITPATSAICGVHLWGNVCDVQSLQSIADRRNLALWFDSSHAFSVQYDGKYVGNFGRAEVFSFHATKFINAFEGGAVVTNDADLAETLRRMRNFGFTDDRQVSYLGINAKMPEVSAAMALRSLEMLSLIKSLNLRNYLRYKERLGSCNGLRLSAPADPANSNCQYVVAEVDERAAGISRDLLLKIMQVEGVIAQRYFYPGCHRAVPYRQSHLDRGFSLPVTEELASSVLVLPAAASISEEDIDRICNLISFIIEKSSEIGIEARNREIL